MTEHLTAQELKEQYGYWGSHPDFPITDWVAEVTNNETRSGYWSWVEECLITKIEFTDS